MLNVFLADFDEKVEMTFGTSAKTAVNRALHLEYSFAEMVRLVALYHRDKDPFLDVDDFVKNGGEMGLKKVLDELNAIAAEL